MSAYLYLKYKNGKPSCFNTCSEDIPSGGKNIRMIGPLFRESSKDGYGENCTMLRSKFEKGELDNVMIQPLGQSIGEHRETVGLH